MVQFLEAYLTDILGLAETVIFVIVAFTLTKKLGNPKYLQGAFDTIMFKYKTEATVKPTVGQKFAHTVPVYELDETTGELVKTDKVINVDELVNSSKDMALNSIYDRFLPDESVNETVSFATHTDKRDNLDVMRESLNYVEQCRAKYKLPADMDAVDVLNYVQKKSVEAKKQIEAVETAKKLPKEENPNA